MEPDEELPENERKELFPGCGDLKQFTKSGFKTLMEAIRTSNALPSGKEYEMYSAQDSYKQIMDKQKEKLLTMMNRILNFYGIKSSFKGNFLDKNDLLVDANDTILERVANYMDELNGIKTNNVEPVHLQVVSANVPINGSWNKLSTVNKTALSMKEQSEDQTESTQVIKLLAGKNIIRPQVLFKDKINNNNSHPWEPKITEKPNSIKPLAIFLEETERGEEYSHPYELELEKFEIPEEFLKPEEPIYPKALDEVEFKEISTPDDLDKLVETLRNYKIIGIDLEHHSYRTFMGITCLMQISTVDADYIIDTLSLRDKLHVLNEIFTKPSILKVFHGAESDISWLQRDLALYVVNMFDTYQAAKLLELNSLSLAHLMQKYCQRSPNKHFQLADWRIRPLPQNLKDYAREDTHYLIYIYQVLKKELRKKANGEDNLLRAVFQRSNDVCKIRYFKPKWNEESHLNLYRKCKRLFDNRQMCALKELYKWRDHIARSEDESTGYVLPNHMLLQISSALPREMQGILACCNPVPPLVKANLLELHHIILRAREKPIEKPILQEDTRAKGSTKETSKLNLESPLHCPHDLTYLQDLPDNLPTLLKENKNDKIIKKHLEWEKTSSVYSIFNSSHKVEPVKTNHLKNLKCLSPYQRYQLVKPLIKFEEAKKAEEEELKNRKKEEENTIKTEPTEDNSIVVIEEIGGIEQVNINLQNIANDNKTDEERINSIKDHFLMLSKKTQEDEKEAEARELALYEQKSLVELGGVKKRKRDDSDEEELEDSKELSLGAKYINAQPLSFYGKFRQQKGQKRKADNEGNDSPPKKMSKTQKKNKNKNKHKPNHNEGKNQVKQGNKKHSNLKNSKEQNNRPHFQRQLNKPNQNFTPYDYAGVDFRQFQGGASEANTGQNYVSKFKNKGAKKSNKFQNKSGSFHNQKKRNK